MSDKVRPSVTDIIGRWMKDIKVNYAQFGGGIRLVFKDRKEEFEKLFTTFLEYGYDKSDILGFHKEACIRNLYNKKHQNQKEWRETVENQWDEARDEIFSSAANIDWDTKVAKPTKPPKVEKKPDERFDGESIFDFPDMDPKFLAELQAGARSVILDKSFCDELGIEE